MVLSLFCADPLFYNCLRRSSKTNAFGITSDDYYYLLFSASRRPATFCSNLNSSASNAYNFFARKCSLKAKKKARSEPPDVQIRNDICKEYKSQLRRFSQHNENTFIAKKEDNNNRRVTRPITRKASQKAEKLLVIFFVYNSKYHVEIRALRECIISSCIPEGFLF